MPISLLTEQVARQGLLAKSASRRLALLTTAEKNKALETLADALVAGSPEIVFHNEIDVQAAQEAGLAPALIERLKLSAKTIQAMAQGVREIAAQPDPIGQVLESWSRPSGITIEKVRVPLGVI